jgi:pyrroline-5-carboxylate reductase
VMEDNAEIVRLSDVIFLGLLPEVARDILPKLDFSNTKAIISMMAAINFEQTCALLTSCDRSKIVRTVPLPSSARRSGPILLHPVHTPVAGTVNSTTLLTQVGTVVPCKAEAEMTPLISITGHISSFFELMNCDQKFVVANGVEPTAAELFISSFYSSLSNYAASAMVEKHSGSSMSAEKKANTNFEEFADEAATPGGLNAQSLEFLRKSTHYSCQTESLTAIHDRLTGKK